MNIGKRIVKRLKDLRWERKDLLERVPDLTTQALSNLIRRDSKRSEWDEKIAAALRVSVLWLVYGIDAPAHTTQEPAVPYKPHLSEDEALLVQAYRAASPDAKNAILLWARTLLPDGKTVNERTGTH